MQIRDGRGPTFRFIARYGAQDAHEHGGVGHSHPLGRAQHRHGESMTHIQRNDGYRREIFGVTTLGAAI